MQKHKTPQGGPDPSRDSLLPDELKTLGPGELLVNEFFHSIQGESTFAGQPCFFIRLAGCHLRCTYCDTDYAFYDGKRITVDACLERVEECGCPLVEVTGGEPLLQKSVLPLLTGLCDRGFQVLLETGGAIDFRKVDPRVVAVVDIKCPSSGMVHHNLRDLSTRLRQGDQVKFVIGDREDYEWARAWLRRERETLPRGIPVHFSPVHGDLAARDLAEWILADGLPVRVNLQLHRHIWPEKTRGA